MDKRYNYTLVNGVKIPSPDNNNRYVPLDIFPSDLLERLEVTKSLTPDMEADAIGEEGSVEITDETTELSGMMHGTLLSGRTYYLTGDLIVEEGREIVMEAGVRIESTAGGEAGNEAFSFIIHGSFYSLGTEENPNWITTVPENRTKENWNQGYIGGDFPGEHIVNDNLNNEDPMFVNYVADQFTQADYRNVHENSAVTPFKLNFVMDQDFRLRAESPLVGAGSDSAFTPTASITEVGPRSLSYPIPPPSADIGAFRSSMNKMVPSGLKSMSCPRRTKWLRS